jgi:hypothetical protein
MSFDSSKVCPKYIECLTCGRNQGKIHVCEGRRCLNCSKSVEMEHKCFILTREEREKSKKRIKNHIKGYIFFDYESMNVDGLHIPDLIITNNIRGVTTTEQVDCRQIETSSF